MVSEVRGEAAPVEDDKKIATAVKRGLEAEGYTVEVRVPTGTYGLWMATEGSYHLIVLDIMLPGRNGYLICADLREAGDWTPILMLTAKGGELDEAEALDTGADDYLAKPFSFPVLLAASAPCCAGPAGRVPGAARGRGAAASTPAAGGSGPARAAGRADRPASTTVLEFARAPGRSGALPRTRSWRASGRSTSPAIRTSSRCTSRCLRRKLSAAAGDEAPIETVRGAGYRLAGDGG